MGTDNQSVTAHFVEQPGHMINQYKVRRQKSVIMLLRRVTYMINNNMRSIKRTRGAQ